MGSAVSADKASSEGPQVPLLLDKLVQTTLEGHADYRHILRAREVAGQVAQDINEIKRRKDLGEGLTWVSVCLG